MSEPKYWLVGKVSVPEEKKAELNSAVLEVLNLYSNTERRQIVHYKADEVAFRVLLCVGGCGTIGFEGGVINFYKGDCVFVPANSAMLTLHGQAQFLDIRG